MSPFLEWIRRQPAQRLFAMAIALFFAFSVLGRLFIPLLVISGMGYLLFRQWGGASTGGGRSPAERSRPV
mgnify:CR=1 FL=1